MIRKITPQQLVNQWKGKRSRFDVNLWNFEIKAGEVAEKVFKGSFAMGRFNSSGSTAWPPRKSPKQSHPILNETGTLRNSITSKVRKRPRQVVIYTDPKKFGTAARHAGFCYAAIHNSPDSKGFRTGRAANIAQRQFIGHSTVLEEELKKIEPMIFAGFPGVVQRLFI